MADNLHQQPCRELTCLYHGADNRAALNAAEKADPDIEYLQHALPLLTAYTQQVVFAVDVDRLCRTASRIDAPAPQSRFLNAVRDFRTALELIEGP